MSVRRAFARLLALVRKSRLERELEDDICSHLELAEHEGLARGLSPEAARLDARRRFGEIEQMKERHRDRRSVPWMEMLFRDFRRGLTSLKRTPGFTAIVVTILALGIGGTVAMFSVVDAVLLHTLPFREPDRIVRIWEAPRPGVSNSTTVPQFLMWKRPSGVFAELAAEQPITSALNDKNGPTRLAGNLVTSAYFKVFPTDTALGRTFTSEDDQPGAAPVVVLSHAAWTTYFGADAGILQRSILLDGEACPVVGVLKPSAFDRDRTQFWKPLVFTPAQRSSQTHWLTVYGRLQAGVGVAQARKRMQAIYAAEVRGEPEDRQGAIAIEPLDQLLVGPNLHRSISIAFGAVFLVLLIACANVANLLVAQGATRSTELAVRAALGAGRGRLVLQLLTEYSALCLIGGLAGVAAAYLFIRLAKPLLSRSLPFTADVSLNPEVLAFAAAVVLGIVLLAGMMPSLQASSGSLSDYLKQSTRASSGTQAPLRRMIVTGELAVSLVLVCGALLFIRSLVKLQHVETGVRVENVMTTSIDLPLNGYPTPERAALFYRALTERLPAIPGIENVGMTTTLPLQWISNGEAVQTAGSEQPVHVRLKRVDSGYFTTVGIPVLAGRGITDRDREGSAPVAVINQALAARLATEPGMKSPVGKVVRLSVITYGKELIAPVQIVGLIRSERTASPGDPDPAVAYVPLAQQPCLNVKLLVRTYRENDPVMRSIREAVREVDPNVPLGSTATCSKSWTRRSYPRAGPLGLLASLRSSPCFSRRSAFTASSRIRLPSSFEKSGFAWP